MCAIWGIWGNSWCLGGEIFFVKFGFFHDNFIENFNCVKFLEERRTCIRMN